MFFVTFDFWMLRYFLIISSSSEKESGFKKEDAYVSLGLLSLFSSISILPRCCNAAEDSFNERGHGNYGCSLREPATDEAAEIPKEKSISTSFYSWLITAFWK